MQRRRSGQVRTPNLARLRSPLTAARGDQGYEQEGGYGDQEVESSTCGVAEDARLRRSRWR
jgi:hypothetical protein